MLWATFKGPMGYHFLVFIFHAGLKWNSLFQIINKKNKNKKILQTSPETSMFTALFTATYKNAWF